MCPAFGLVDYKVKGSTLTTVVLDGLYLLQRIDMEDLRFHPDDRLLIEIHRLEVLKRDTLA